MGSWAHQHLVLILTDMFWFLPRSCLCCFRIWLCAVKSMHSLIACLFFSCGFMLPVLSWFYLLWFSMYRILCRILSSGDFVVMYCISFWLLWKIFIALSMIVFLDRLFYNWSHFHSIPEIPHSLSFFILRNLLRNLLPSNCYSLLEWPSTVFFVWL
jgi:hypothetical protein